MNARDYFKKFGAYYRYGMTGRFQRDYNTYPTILVVTSDNAAEERIARVARAAAAGQPGKLPLLLTCQWRIDDATNSDGLLGQIWREPDSGFDNRRRWPRIINTKFIEYSASSVSTSRHRTGEHSDGKSLDH